MRIAFITGQLGFGGAERQLYYLLRDINQSVFEPVVLTLNPGAGDFWEGPIQKLGVTLIPVPRAARWRRVLKIASILRQYQSDLVHGWDFYTNPYAAVAGRLARVKAIVGSLQSEAALAEVGGSGIAEWVARNGVQVIIANSNNAASQFLEMGVANHRIRVVHSAVDVYPPDVGHSPQLPSGLDQLVASGAPVIGSIGRMDEYKNHTMLLEVCVRLRQEFPNLRCLLVGDGPLRPWLEAETKRLGLESSVLFVGRVPEARDILPLLWVYCMTSYSEGLPVAVMEASAAGVPVVVTAAGGTAEVVEDGQTGYIVPVGDTNQMATCVAQLLRCGNIRQRLGEAGRRKVQTQFSVQRMVNGTVAVYEELLSDRRGTGFESR